MSRAPHTTLGWAILLAGLCTTVLRAAAPQPDAEQLRFFEAKVRPTLAESCWKCHGETKQKGGLRLDQQAAVLAGGDTGPAVVPGKPDESLLLTAISHEDTALKMPPSKRLTQPQIDDLKRWVAMGAPWPADGPKPSPTAKRPGMTISEKDRAHWAFRPVKAPQVPASGGSEPAGNPIDAFLTAKLAANGLAPNPPASMRELARRAYYDLTGLPPTPEEVEAFLADSSPLAYEKLVDRLLDSPRYGEKWARHWLDLVRFAETNSYERDNPKPNAWRYRDYVIRAFNQDKPYDRFVREQLAGDELPDADLDALIATGYYRLGIWDDEPSDREQSRYDSLDDIVATTGQVFLGMTIDCARCHDHKLDPIPQKDYYRLLAFFQNINHFRNGGRTDEVPLFASSEERAEYQAAVADLERRRNEAQAKLTGIEAEFRSKYAASRRESVGHRDLDELRFRFYRDTWERLPDFSALKYEDEGPLPKGLFELAPRTRDTAFGFVFEGTLIVPEAGKYTFYLDSDDGSKLVVDGKTVIEYDGIHGEGQERSESVELPKGRLPIRLDYFQKYNGLGLTVAWSGPQFGRRPLSARFVAGGRDEPAPADVAKLIKTLGEKLLGAERNKEYQTLRRSLRAMKDVAPAAMALCVTEAGTAAPETFVLVRGNAHVHGDRVEPGFMQVLGAPSPTIPKPAPGAASLGRRRVLADWIVSPENPLAPRVMVNRIWQRHFGRGIVRSPNNFGIQGDKPTHPELLDWLAAEFVRQGWRLKPIHRLIMTSRAYRMSSRANPEALAKDPTNDLFWRFEMRRLEAEEIRDAILAVSGTLRAKMYGPGIYPEIPAAVLAGQSIPGKGWGHSPPEEENRRSIYIHLKRSLLMPILESFDVAETDRSTPTRFATTQPTQALALLNSDFLHKHAAILAERVRREVGDDPRAQVDRALRLALTRPPSAAEVGRGVDLIASLGSSEGDPRRALESFCLVVLNLNEFVYLD